MTTPIKDYGWTNDSLLAIIQEIHRKKAVRIQICPVHGITQGADYDFCLEKNCGLQLERKCLTSLNLPELNQIAFILVHNKMDVLQNEIEKIKNDLESIKREIKGE